jgi:hypothetical protein
MPHKIPKRIKNGSRREFDGYVRVYYDGYWIKWYEPPQDSLEAKKRLIEALTCRLFNHVEHGLNIPGKRLDEAREAYEAETEPARKRVKGAMLAGALINRAKDIFTRLVELQAVDVEVESDNPLMQECGRCLLEALEFGKTVRHRSGEEGIDELWGEPFKAFSMPVEAFYESRYLKIAQTMREIDRVAAALAVALEGSRHFEGVGERLQRFAAAARDKCETLRTDAAIFDVWATFVAAGDQLCEMAPLPAVRDSILAAREEEDGHQLIRDGKHLLTHIARARVSMPKSTAVLLKRCECYRKFRSTTLDGTRLG